jgi:predicted regulator of Ras-like GTPase activity (Roadblock/LC7/MglB family)
VTDEVFATVLDRVSRVPGVRGVLVVDAQAGVPVVAEVEDGVADSAVAALATALFRRAARAAEGSEFGHLDALQLEAEGGHVVVAGAGELLLVAVAAGDAQLGLLRLEVQRAVEDLW